MTKYASINPANAPAEGTQQSFDDGFAALVNVKTSRYVKYEYQPESGIAPKIGIKWTMGTTKGNTFDRQWSTGLPWEGNENAISADGKHLSGQIKRNSDGFYMLEKAVEAGFPADKLTDDISIFEGETFFIADGTNPRSRGSAKKPYPKKYHPEGWEAALAETLRKRAERAAKESAPAYQPAQLQGSYAPPAVLKSDDVLKTAGDALVAILLDNGSTVARNQIPAKLNAYVDKQQKSGNVWDPNLRREVSIALWDIQQLQAVVGNNPTLKMDGETISFK